MKFQCSSCGLRMESLHFKQAGLMNPKLTSICDICLQRGRKAEDFPNQTVEIFAKALLYSFVGKDGKDNNLNFFSCYQTKKEKSMNLLFKIMTAMNLLNNN